MKYIAFCLVMLYNLSLAQATCDTLLQNKVNEIYRDSDRIDSLKIQQLQEIIKYSLAGDTDSSCKILLGTTLVMQGNLYKRLGAYPESKEKYDSALSIREELVEKGIVKDYNGIVSIYNNLTHWAELQEKKSTAIRYANKVIDTIRLKHPIRNSLLAKVYINRALAYRGIKSYDNAKADYKSARNLLSPNASDHALIWRGLSDVARGQKDYGAAIDYAQKAVDLYRSQGNKFNLASTYNGIATCYLAQEKLEEAQEQYEQSLELATEIRNPKLRMDAHINLITLHTKKQELAKAEEYETRLKDIIKQSVGSESDELYITRSLARLYKENGKHEKALEYSEKAYELHDVIKSEEERKKVSEIKGELENERSFQNLLKGFIAALLLLGLATFGIFWQRQKRKKEARIAAEKERAAKERETALKRDFETHKKKETITHLKKGRERVKRDVGGLATDLHDEKTRVAAVKRDLEYVLNNVDKPDVITVLDKAIDISTTIFFNLRKISLALRDTFDWSKQMLYDIEQLERKASIEIESKNFNIDETIHDEIGEELSKVFGVLLDNIHQHAEATKVSVDFTRTENEIIVLVEDNGNGFDPETVTYNVGLKSVKDRVEKTLKGKLDIDAAKGRGAIFIITVPV